MYICCVINVGNFHVQFTGHILRETETKQSPAEAVQWLENKVANDVRNGCFPDKNAELLKDGQPQLDVQKALRQLLDKGILSMPVFLAGQGDWSYCHYLTVVEAEGNGELSYKFKSDRRTTT